MSLKRRQAAGAAPRGAALPADGFRLLYPGLWEFLRVTAWPDGSPRETGSLLLFDDQGVPKARLVDRDLDEVLFVAGDSVEGLLATLERVLTEGGGDWRRQKPFPQAGGGGAGRKKG